MTENEKLAAELSAEETPAVSKSSEVKSVLRFLHCSDVHLDTPFVGLPAEKSEERRRELRASFLKMMQYVRDREIDVVLISGDLFDVKYATNTTAEILIRELKNCPETVFIIAPGRCDCYRDNPIYTSGRLPKNCYVFNKETLSRFDIDQYNLTVYGWAFTEPELRVSPLTDKRVDDTSRINIVCGYGDLDGEVDGGLCPIRTEDLKKFGADYYALGSHHEADNFNKLGDSIYSYCGSLECTGFEDPGIGGTNLITSHYKDGELSVDVKKLTFGHLHFRTEKIDITGLTASGDIMKKISCLISDKKYGIETALRIVLTGSVDPAFTILHNFESEAFGLYSFDLIDRTLPLFNTEHFERDMSPKGELYRTLLPYLKSEEEEVALIAAKAFRSGLAALENRDVD